MNQIDYPTLRLGALKPLLALKAAFQEDEAVLNISECPYPPEITDILKLLFEKTVVERIIEKTVTVTGKRGPSGNKGLSAEDQAEVEKELKETLQDLRKMGEGEKDLDTSTKLAILKTKTQLIEQIIKGRERVMNLKRQAEFEGVVIAILDDLVPANDRDNFLERISPYREG
jgi:hypothetical protein